MCRIVDTVRKGDNNDDDDDDDKFKSNDMGDIMELIYYYEADSGSAGCY